MSDQDRTDIFSASRLAEILEPDAVAEREALDADELANQAEAAFDDAMDAIERMIYLRAIDSRVVSDIFWKVIEDHISNGEKVTLGNRVRVTDGTLVISYHRNVYQGKDGSYFADHIKRSGKLKYNPRDFRSAHGWERDLALSFEEHHSRNRKMFNYLSEARRNMRIAMRELRKVKDEK